MSEIKDFLSKIRIDATGFAVIAIVVSIVIVGLVSAAQRDSSTSLREASEAAELEAEQAAAELAQQETLETEEEPEQTKEDDSSSEESSPVIQTPAPAAEPQADEPTTQLSEDESVSDAIVPPIDYDLELEFVVYQATDLGNEVNLQVAVPGNQPGECEFIPDARGGTSFAQSEYIGVNDQTYCTFIIEKATFPAGDFSFKAEYRRLHDDKIIDGPRTLNFSIED